MQKNAGSLATIEKNGIGSERVNNTYMCLIRGANSMLYFYSKTKKIWKLQCAASL